MIIKLLGLIMISLLRGGGGGLWLPSQRELSDGYVRCIVETIYLFTVDVNIEKWVDGQQNIADVGVNNVILVALFQLFDYGFLHGRQ